MPRLTEANYQSRKIKLNAAIGTARAAHMEVSMRREIDEATDVDVRAARDAVTALTDRVAGLDAAFERAQADAASEMREQQMAAAFKSAEVVGGILLERSAIATQIEQATADLGGLYGKMQDLAASIMREVAPHAKRSRGLLDSLRETLNGQFNDVRNPIGRELAGNGLDMSGAATRGYASDHEHQRSVVAFTNRTNIGIERVTNAIFTQREQEIAA